VKPLQADVGKGLTQMQLMLIFKGLQQSIYRVAVDKQGAGVIEKGRATQTTATHFPLR
jgi:hypothetical protein